MKTSLIDGDIILYQIANRADDVYYQVGNESFKYKRDIPLHFDPTKIKKLVNTIPDDEIYLSLNDRINSIVESSGCNDKRLYITGKRSIRKQQYPLYKANRIDYQKPTKFDFVRQLLIDEFKAIEINGLEADDALGIVHSERMDSTVICTIDKDLDMVPGYHYNWGHDELYTIYPHEGSYNFFIQLLTGDRSDNICGIKGVGKVTAEKMLQGCDDFDSMYSAVYLAYKKFHRSSLSEEVIEVIDMNANLLWIKRSKDSVWNDARGDF